MTTSSPCSPSRGEAWQIHFAQDRSVISRHLRQLSEAGVLVREKRSRSVIYSIDGSKFLSKLEDIVALTRTLVEVCCPGPDGRDESCAQTS